MEKQQIGIDTKIHYMKIKILESGKVEYNESTYRVLDFNDEYFVINDLHFTTLTFDTKDNSHPALDRGRVWLTDFNIRGMEEYLFGYIYSTQKDSKKVFNKLKKVIEAFIAKKCFYISNFKEIIKHLEYEHENISIGQDDRSQAL